MLGWLNYIYGPALVSYMFPDWYILKFISTMQAMALSLAGISYFVI